MTVLRDPQALVEVLPGQRDLLVLLVLAVVPLEPLGPRVMME